MGRAQPSAPHNFRCMSMVFNFPTLCYVHAGIRACMHVSIYIHTYVHTFPNGHTRIAARHVRLATHRVSNQFPAIRCRAGRRCRMPNVFKGAIESCKEHFRKHKKPEAGHADHGAKEGVPSLASGRGVFAARGTPRVFSEQWFCGGGPNHPSPPSYPLRTDGGGGGSGTPGNPPEFFPSLCAGKFFCTGGGWSNPHPSGGGGVDHPPLPLPPLINTWPPPLVGGGSQASQRFCSLCILKGRFAHRLAGQNFWLDTPPGGGQLPRPTTSPKSS